jgi:hypothetical protein
MTRKQLAFLVILALLTTLLAARVDRLTTGVYTLKLIGGCYLDCHVPIQSVGLACLGVDYIRLWPLPMVQPWPDPTDWPEGPGWYA